MTAAERPFTGRHMLALMVAFFTVVIAANMTLVYFASHSWTGLVVKNSYVASQEFNEATAKLQRAEAGLHVQTAYRDGTLTAALLDQDRRPFRASTVAITVGRPSHEGEDQTVTLTRQAEGLYVAQLPLARGQWTGMLTATSTGGEELQRPIRLIVEN